MSRLAPTWFTPFRSPATARPTQPRRNSPAGEERAVANLLYPVDRRNVKAVPVDPPIQPIHVSDRAVGSGRSLDSRSSTSHEQP